MGKKIRLLVIKRRYARVCDRRLWFRIPDAAQKFPVASHDVQWCGSVVARVFPVVRTGCGSLVALRLAEWHVAC